MTLVRSGETLDNLARQMAACSPALTRERAKAIIIENNGLSEPVRITEGRLLVSDPSACPPGLRDRRIATSPAIEQQFGILDDRAWSVLEHHANVVPIIGV